MSFRGGIDIGGTRSGSAPMDVVSEAAREESLSASHHHAGAAAPQPLG